MLQTACCVSISQIDQIGRPSSRTRCAECRGRTSKAARGDWSSAHEHARGCTHQIANNSTGGAWGLPAAAISVYFRSADPRDDCVLSSAGRRGEDIPGHLSAARLHRVPAHGRRERATDISSHPHHGYVSTRTAKITAVSMVSSGVAVGGCLMERLKIPGFYEDIFQC